MKPKRIRMIENSIFEIMMKNGKKTYFYPSCGNDIHPQIFDLDCDLFVFCDYVDSSSSMCFNEKLLGEKLTKDFHYLYSFYINMQDDEYTKREGLGKINIDLRELKWFWRNFYGHFTRFPHNPSSLKIHFYCKDYVLFEYNSKPGILFFWDNNLTLAFLRHFRAKIACFVGKNDGCNEGGNYECINTERWIKQIAEMSSRNGFTYITDHFNGYDIGEQREPSIEGYTAEELYYQGWLRENKIENEIFISEDPYNYIRAYRLLREIEPENRIKNLSRR